MRIMFSSLLLLTGCFSISDTFVVTAPNPKKMKQKIAVLQKKLDSAEKEYNQAKEEVEKLSDEINEMQLALIRSKVDKYEKKNEKDTSLFLDEREQLYKIIQTGPSPAAFDAQVELDRILRIITEVSDNV